MSEPVPELKRARRAFFGTRSRVAGFLRAVAAIRVSPEFRGLRWLTAIFLILVFLQFATGILLSLYYYPEPGAAYESIRYLNGHVSTGWLIRSTHIWAGELCLLAALGHVLFVFFRRAYRYPREYEWVVGVLLLPALLAFRFTGRLLPWDQPGLEASRRGLELLETAPIIGSWASYWLQGGEDMGPNTLSRFFATHVLILPWLLLLLLAAHFYLVRQHGLRRRGE